jgi:chemotaxis methyl-accepting protein methylase
MSLLDRLAKVKALRAGVGVSFFELSRRLWALIPKRLHGVAPVRAYGGFLLRLARLRQTRSQSSLTCFLRNRAEIDYIARLGRSVRGGGRISIAIFGCSTGAEAYSASYALRDSMDRIQIEIHASDISRENIEAAEAALFDSKGKETEHLTAAETDALFEKSGDRLKVREQWRRPARFSVVDAMAPGLAERAGVHDLVIANKFLCHMPPEMARQCLRNLATTVRPGGVLIVSGVDLDVRSAVAAELGFVPDESAIEALHEGDVTLRGGWPFEYWGLEPIDRGRKDFALRYAAAFKRPDTNPTVNPFPREAPGEAAARLRA